VALDLSDLTQHVDPARLRLARAVRALLDVGAGPDADHADPAALDAAAAAVEEAVARVSAATGREPGEPRAPRAPLSRYAEVLPHSSLVGTVSAIAPDATWTFADGVLEVHATFGLLCEGPPGSVHGGFVALAFDDALGMTNVLSGLGGFTGRLTVRYRARTPLHEELVLRAWVDRHEGRRTVTRGELHHGDTLCAEAEGLFVRTSFTRDT